MLLFDEKEKDAAGDGPHKFEVLVVGEESQYEVSKEIMFGGQILSIESDTEPLDEWAFTLITDEPVRPWEIEWTLESRDPLES